MENSTQQIKYAGFWTRYVASTIDSFVLFVVQILIQFIFSLVINQLITEKPILTTTISIILSTIIAWFYFIYLTYRYGGSLGKLFVGIIVQSSNETPLSLNRIIVRETIGKILSSITLFIGYIMVAFTSRKQGLHDKITKTVVIYKDPQNPFNLKFKIAVFVACILPLLAILGILTSVILASLNTARLKGIEAENNYIENSKLTNTYVNKKFGYEITLPEGWTIYNYSNGFDITNKMFSNELNFVTLMKYDSAEKIREEEPEFAKKYEEEYQLLIENWSPETSESIIFTSGDQSQSETFKYSPDKVILSVASIPMIEEEKQNEKLKVEKIILNNGWKATLVERYDEPKASSLSIEFSSDQSLFNGEKPNSIVLNNFGANNSELLIKMANSIRINQ